MFINRLKPSWPLSNLLIVLSLVLIFAGNSPSVKAEDDHSEHKHETNDTFVVGVSILPQAFFVERLAGSLVNVVIMIPPGASPATYEPTTVQLTELSRAKMYIKVGHPKFPFEKTWFDKLKSVNKAMHVVDSSNGVEIIDSDPHIWLSPKAVKKQVENIYQELCRIEPEHQQTFEWNKQLFMKEIDELDHKLQQKLSALKSKKFMVYHPAWGYFARDYGLEQLPVEIEGKEPSPAFIASIIKKARTEGIKTIFVQSQFSRRSADVVAREIGGRVVPLDPLDRYWLSNMERIADALIKGIE